ncbi:MAG TPA: hypothetical protein VFV92_14475, partial [Candidatus Bathyarchaeia archaeon]|nr:hypothetical protein [Candidatus Bathyarchaeia archaeon]
SGFGINSFTGFSRFGFNHVGSRFGFGSGFGFGFGWPWWWGATRFGPNWGWNPFWLGFWSGWGWNLNDDPPVSFEPPSASQESSTSNVVIGSIPGPVLAPDSYAPPCPSVSDASQAIAPSSPLHVATTTEAS